ncbi:cytochrome C biosynthesis protein [Shewanella algae]|uniref:cytochrome C biosynthesis protein n=1 Tax=Shewanella algae TaxID=38313 RepID=UPI0031F4A61F
MLRTLFLCLLLSFSAGLAATENSASQIQWQQVDQQGQIKIPLYFVWSKTCPHCAEAHPFIDSLPERYPWIELHSVMVGAKGTQELWQQLATETGTEARSVPYMATCGKAIVGYSSEEVTGQFLLNRLKNCYLQAGGQLSPEDMPGQTSTQANTGSTQAPLFGTCANDGGDGTCDATALAAEPEVQPVELPLVGVVTPETMSLPILTLVLAGVDAFNPCAFFVLLFLLSIMVNAKSRSRMLLVGGIFVFFSGFIYFLFMTAWLNIFQLFGAGSDGGMIILAAGILALIAGSINVKDYFVTKGEVTLSMSAENRTGLIKRMGKLSSASSLATMIAGTTVLAILANAYELLCTAGFPMIYTSVLSMHNLPSFERYMYLVLYNIVYVIPLAIIVIAFSMTLGKRKLTEKEGQTLKLMSGIMMLGLGGTLAVNPAALQSVTLALGLIIGAIVVTILIVSGRKLLERRRKAA